MPYTHARLRNALALVRIGTGLVFVDLAWYKISSVEFARVDFLQFLWAAMHGGAVTWFGKFLESFIWPNATKTAVVLGFVEMAIGVGLVLGLIVRPICFVGAGYMATLVLATWHQSALAEPLWIFPNEALRYIIPLFVFVLLAIGHAGENWGLGALYHRHRHKRWEKQWQIKMVPGLPTDTKPEVPRGQA